MLQSEERTSKNRLSVSRSLRSLYTLNGLHAAAATSSQKTRKASKQIHPGYSGVGVYSKSAMSSDTIWCKRQAQLCHDPLRKRTSRLTMRTPSPSNMKEIIMTESCSAFGNLSGALVVSISNAWCAQRANVNPHSQCVVTSEPACACADDSRAPSSNRA